MGESGASQGESPRDEQSETVSAPHPDEAPPRRGVQPVLWIAVGLAAVLVLAVLLVYEAIKAG